MTLHKLTAGDGYMYLIKQVAANDSTVDGRSALSDYYSSKGESPGVWIGSGLASLEDGPAAGSGQLGVGASPALGPSPARRWTNRSAGGRDSTRQQCGAISAPPSVHQSE